MGLLMVIVTVIIFLFIIFKLSGYVSAQNRTAVSENIQHELRKLNIKSLKDYKEYEESAMNKAFSPLAQVKLCPEDLKDIPSSLGVFGYSQDRLITSISIKPDSAGNADPIQYFFELKKLGVKDRYHDIIAHLCENKDIDSLSVEELEKLEKHIRVLEGWNREEFKLDAFQIIPVQNIAYYKVTGSKQYIADVHGGGSNIKGAVVGSVLAGEVGAIVGSRTEIKTNVKEKDDRRLFIYFTEDNEVHSEEIITEQIDSILDLLRSWMPQKDYEYIAVFGVQKSCFNNDSVSTV